MIEAFYWIWINEKHGGHRISTASVDGASVVFCEECEVGTTFGDPKRAQAAWDRLDAAYRTAEELRITEGRG